MYRLLPLTVLLFACNGDDGDKTDTESTTETETETESG